MASHDEAVRLRFLDLLRRALHGWRDKVVADFSEVSYTLELRGLKQDPVYADFRLACPEYVLVRLMGRMSISFGRRLGELHDNLPKYVAAARFGLVPVDVAAKIGNLNLDVRIPLPLLTPEDRSHVQKLTEAALGRKLKDGTQGLGIEIRYNFNPNDSARLRKDVDMARGLLDAGLEPIYLVFSGISPRHEAMDRLRRAGWTFLIASKADEFVNELLGLNLRLLLQEDSVQVEIKKEMDATWLALFGSHAFVEAATKYRT